MPPRKPEGVTIGFLGTGTMDVDQATDLIEEFIEGTITSDEDPVTFLFPLTTDEFSDTMEQLVEMAQKSDITYEVITSTADKRRGRFTEIANNAAKTYHVADVYTQMEHILTEAPKALLEVLWDQERDQELTEIIGKFVDAGLDVKDLTDGNTPMADEDENGGTAEAVAVEEAEGEEEDEELPIYAKTDLEKLSRAEVKEISLKLGLPPRKSSAAMIEEILEAQGEPGEPEEAAVVEVVEVATAVLQVSESQEDLVQALTTFPGRLHDVLDEFVTSLGKMLDGTIFNATPEEPMAVEEPEPSARASRRRLSRAR
jgi:hypothetical protein